MRNIAASISVIAALTLGLLGASPAMAAKTLSAPISAQTIPNDGAQHAIGSVSFPAINPVNALAGQQLGGSSFTLQTDAAPSTYPTPGTLIVNSLDQFGNGIQNTLSYTGISGNSFTGVSGGIGTTVAGLANPSMTGSVSINRTAAGNHPWLNTLTSTSQLSVLIQSSADGGATWQDEASATTPGGIFTDKNGTVTTSGLDVGPINPKATTVRMLVVVTGPSAVEVSGTATVLTR